MNIESRSFRQFVAGVTVGVAVSTGAFSQEQGRRVDGPVLGYLYQPSEGIRPVYGIPGSAVVGPAPVLPAEAVRNAVVAPARDHALIVLSEGEQVAVASNLSGSPRVQLLDVQAGPARIVFSPDGSAAALYYKDPARLEVLTGLPEAPAAAWSWDLSGLPELDAMALGPAGRLALVAASSQPGPVWLLTAQEGPRWIHLTTASPRLAFLPEGDSALIADGGTGEVWVARHLNQQPAQERVAGQDQRVMEPVAVAASRDGRKIYVAAGDPPGVLVLGPAGEEPLWLSCPCRPRTLEEMASGAVFLLSEGGAEGPVWLLEDSGGAPRLLFVPDAARQPRATVPSRSPRGTGGVR